MSTATEMLALYLAAEQAILAGKEFRFADRAVRREDLPEIRAGRQEWEQKAAAEQRHQSGRSGVRFAVARLE